MRTLALTAALATALAGTGCIVTTDSPTGDLDVAWRFRSGARIEGNFVPGNTGCDTAAVTDVRVALYPPGGSRAVFDASYNCTDNTGYPRAYLSNVPVGRYDYVIEAWRVDAPVFDGVGSVDVFTNDVTQANATLDVLTTAPLTVYYSGTTCAATPDIFYDAYYPSTDTVPFDSQPVPCNGSYGFTLAQDQVTGRTYGIDVYASIGGTYTKANCLSSVFHDGFPQTIALLSPGASGCP